MGYVDEDYTSGFTHCYLCLKLRLGSLYKARIILGEVSDDIIVSNPVEYLEKAKGFQLVSKYLPVGSTSCRKCTDTGEVQKDLLGGTLRDGEEGNQVGEQSLRSGGGYFFGEELPCFEALPTNCDWSVKRARADLVNGWGRYI